MLQLRPTCENCNTPLPPESQNAWICSFECTFCTKCVHEVLEGACPNCGGGFEKRPVRPTELLSEYPASSTIVYKPIDR